MHRRAFSLIEVMTVLVIIAITAAAVMMRPMGWFTAAKLDDAIGRVTFMDQMTRQAARRSGKAFEVTFDLREGAIERREIGEGAISAGSHRVALPDGYVMRKVIVNGDNAVTVRYTSDGDADSFAIEIAGSDGISTWVLIAGLSGQVTRMAHEQEVTHVLASLTS
ncbi:MAG: prepilin-type N-terminal cleavage/methylation domain-containing protein [Planctomycetes bacterium]|nr:prepilin-type N-terminal cleavage/methylation domain-containing protein [Planctomycetota bacterium]